MNPRWPAFAALVSILGLPGMARAQPADAPRPIDAFDSVWIEELTWMEVRDAIAAGKTTAIIATGGVEPNGPYLATGKHNVILRGSCEAIARKLGDALCAPIVKFVPEGRIDPPSGHMRSPGTISLRQETFQALLDDIASSLKVHGFRHIVFIGDSGGNVSGMEAVATSLNERWAGSGTTAYHIAEFYSPGYSVMGNFATNELGIVRGESDGYHDSWGVTALMMVTDINSVRFQQRVRAGLASIDGISLTPLDQRLAQARMMQDFRADYTVKLIRERIAAGR